MCRSDIQFSESFEIDGHAMFEHAKGIWVEPKLLAEIEYRAKSAAGTSGTRSSAAYGTCDAAFLPRSILFAR